MKASLTLETPSYKEVVRVSSNNNFNCTPAEYAQLDRYVVLHPKKYFFVNSNIKTPNLLSLNDHSYKAVITINPNLIVRKQDVQKLYKLRKDIVAFVRVKYIPDSAPITNLIQELSEKGYQVVITIQRYNKKDTLNKYGDEKDYKYSCSRYRLVGEALTKILQVADSTPDAHICDRDGLGCGGCGLCARLTLGEDVKIKKLDMSSSGECPYQCPDCYAQYAIKTMVRGMGNTPTYDVIKQNAKQAGRTKHIQHAKEACV